MSNPTPAPAPGAEENAASYPPQPELPPLEVGSPRPQGPWEKGAVPGFAPEVDEEGKASPEESPGGGGACECGRWPDWP